MVTADTDTDTDTDTGTESPFEQWTRDDGRLLKTTLGSQAGDSVPVTEACQRARYEIAERIESQDAYAIPLFESKAPVESDAYVQYRPDSEEVKFFDSGNKTIRWVSADALATTQVGQRLKWWLPRFRNDFETVPDDKLPPATVHATDALSNSESDEFFSDMRDFVRKEREAKKEENREQYDTLGLDRAIASGAVAGPLLPLGAAPYEGDRVYKFLLGTEESLEDALDDDDETPNLRDDADIFPENLYIAGMEYHRSQFPLEMESVYVGDSELWLRPTDHIREGSAADRALTDGSKGVLWLHNLLNPLPYKRRIAALRSVQDNPHKRDLLTGNRRLQFEVDPFDIPAPPIELNASQTQAFNWAKAAEDCLCIHGPPGAGKTRTLTAYIRNAVDRGQRVLVTAHSNQAVDNLLVGDSTVDEPEAETLHAMAEDDETDLTISRAGSNSENSVVSRHYEHVSAGQADVVAATTSGAAQFKSSEFDVAVVDEATQASRAATTIALDVARKLILAGDHKQLPPYSASDDSIADEQRPSLFETLLTRYGEGIAIMLTTQYRMHEAIAAFPNNEFYDGELATAAQNEDWTVDDLTPLMGVNIDGTERQETAGHSYYNDAEAEATAKQVKLLTNSGLPPSDIGVIAGYSAQVATIREHIQQLDVHNIHEVTVDTVDSFQGSERKAMIVSLVRSNENAASGFLTNPDEGPRRLNVALTRARKRLVVIANWDTLATRATFRAPGESCADLYQRLESHIRDANNMLDQAASTR